MGTQANEFIWLLSDVDSCSAEDYLVSMPLFPENYTFEVNLGAQKWLQKALQGLRSGIVLIIDYGYARHELFHQSRQQGTLRCYYQHRAHDDPFFLPGLQDITASVNFTELAESAARCGAQVIGFTTLNRFLIDVGAEQIFQELLRGEPTADYRLSQEAKKLLLPSEMGETVKVMALASNFDGQILGFRNDLSHTLTELSAGGDL